MSEVLRTDNLEIVCKEALAQARADIIDVNMGTFSVDEVMLLPRAVPVVTDTVNVSPVS